jgi:acyl-homoserine lactone synthase
MGMISVHVVNALNKHLYSTEFREYLSRRHDVFVHQKGWRPPASSGLELDQYDTDQATYLLGLEHGHVVTGARLIPTSERHLVSDIFPHFCEATGVIRRTDVGEWTRTYVYGDTTDRGLRGTLTQLCCAVMEFALEEGLSAVGGIQETYFMPHHTRLRWRARPCGLAREVNGEWYVVAYIDVNEAALANVRALLGINRSLLVRRGAQTPFVKAPAIEREVAYA